jgi:hypothetical protein
LGKPVLVCPGDGDVLDETFGPYELGFIANTATDARKILEKHFTAFLQQRNVVENADRNYALKFTREEQTKVLAGILDKIKPKN